MALSYTEAQIQSKLDSIDTLETDVATNSSDIDTLQTDVQTNASDIDALETTVGTLSTKVDETFTSVSSGKSLVASAITDMGVSTASDATFSTMANNIKSIATGGGGQYIANTATSATTTTIDSTKEYYIISYMFRNTSYYAIGLWHYTNGTLTAMNAHYSSTTYYSYITPTVSGNTMTIPRCYSSTYPSYYAIAEV